MQRLLVTIFAIAIFAFRYTDAEKELVCEVYAQTTAGVVCGTRRVDARGKPFASFRGVPYAQQPVKKLRFKPLLPIEEWEGVLNATIEGPVCPQTDIVYGPLMRPLDVSEACIYANVHVPLDVLPELNERVVREVEPAYAGEVQVKARPGRGVPVLVFVHGGGFAMGSGNADLHGPERLVSERLIVITFNYRLNIFGFLSLNNSDIPGNNGLRDMVHLLRWVRDNARFFGGDPRDVTLAGQSAGASAAHLLALSPAAQGLFKRVILMSGTAIPSYYTTSPIYANLMADTLLSALGLNRTTTSSIEIYRQLVEAPLETLMDINAKLQDATGLVTFLPVIETPFQEVEQILDVDTEAAIASGRDSKIPMLIGFTNLECEVFRPRFDEINIVSLINRTPLAALPLHLTFTRPMEISQKKLELINEKYYQGGVTTDKFIKACTDLYFQHPTLKVAEYRQQILNAAPTYLYEFAYNADVSTLKEALHLTYDGAAHIEDLTYIFDVHSVDVKQSPNDQAMNWMMTSFIKNFIYNGHPSFQKTWMPAGVDTWRPISQPTLRYQYIDMPCSYKNWELTKAQADLLAFVEELKNTDYLL